HIKSFPQYGHTFWWHFINLKEGLKYQEVKANPKGDIVEAIGRFSKQLADTSLDLKTRQEALKWLVHLLGDIHQPLHAGKAKDQGGNLVKVKWFGEKSNLHEVWDQKIIDFQQLSYTEFSDGIRFASISQIEKWQNSDVFTWLDEVMVLRKRVYDLKSEELSYSYQAHNKGLVDSQLLKAGVRLAGLLNKLLSQQN
ncbi:S1/P1 nuclease, partial [bacterium]|nr:S1/P1 nuclease [bacterium]